MIESPPLLTVRRRFRRPTGREIAGFRGVPASMIADAQRGRGGLDPRLKPIDPDAAMFVGPVVTAWCGAADNLAALAALEVARRGDVIAIACDGFDAAAVVGDRFAGMARNRGIAGIIVDGPVRDRPGMRQAGVPCYARGATPTCAYSLGPGEVGLPIVIGTTRIETGDLAIADGDGIVVVSSRETAQVMQRLEQIKESEDQLDREVAAGRNGFAWVGELMKSTKTKYVK